MSLVDATLNFDFIRPGGDSNDDSDLDPDDGYESIQKVLRGLLESLVHVKNITLGTWAIQVLSIMEAKGLRSPLLKCECLRLDTHIFKSVLPGIANLLETSPNLETFRVTAMSSSCYCKYYGDKLAELCKFKKHHYLRSQKRTFKCLTLHLKKVEFTAGLRWLCCCDHKFSFVRFLLKNARVLQSMVIHMPSEDGRTPLELYQAAQKLLSFPSSSPDAVVVFS